MWSDAIPVAHLMQVAPKKTKIPAVSTEKPISVPRALALGALVLGCSSTGNQLGGTGGKGGTGGPGGAGNSPTSSAYLPGCQ